jgi:hypothetical protein
MKSTVFASGSTVVAALALLIAACTTTSDGRIKPTTGLCSNANEHCINVYLANNKIEVDVSELYVVGPNHKIYWQIDPGTANGYTFPQNGIVLPGSAGTEFMCQAIHGGIVFFCNDKNTHPGTYKYTINLNGPRPVPPLDPTIKNG